MNPIEDKRTNAWSAGNRHPIMRTLILAMVFGASTAFSAEWAITEGGLSPSKKLAVAIFPQKSNHVDEADGTVLLVDPTTGKKIGPLEEIDSTGGTWGKTNENVRCQWSADSSLLLVNFRCGRMMHNFQIYRIRGHRAIPLTLPALKGHPKAKVLDVLGYNANPGAVVSLTKDGSIVEERYGFMPKEGHWDEDYSKYGLKDFDAVGGTLYFIFRFDDKGQLQLHDIMTKHPTQ